jgi:hypothetical protein
MDSNGCDRSNNVIDVNLPSGVEVRRLAAGTEIGHALARGRLEATILSEGSYDAFVVTHREMTVRIALVPAFDVVKRHALGGGPVCVQDMGWIDSLRSRVALDTGSFLLYGA